MMDAVLRGLTWQSCLVYPDDVIVFINGDVASHVVELAKVLERLSQAGRSLKAKKCTLAAERLEYLGHELDADGVRPMENLVGSVKDFPVPNDTTKVKRFIHMAGYYKRFVPEFTSRAAPTKEGRDVVLGRRPVTRVRGFEERADGAATTGVSGLFEAVPTRDGRFKDRSRSSIDAGSR